MRKKGQLYSLFHSGGKSYTLFWKESQTEGNRLGALCIICFGGCFCECLGFLHLELKSFYLINPISPCPPPSCLCFRLFLIFRIKSQNLYIRSYQQLVTVLLLPFHFGCFLFICLPRASSTRIGALE